MFYIEILLEIVVIVLNFLIYCKYYAGLDQEIVEVVEDMTKTVIVTFLMLILLAYFAPICRFVVIKIVELLRKWRNESILKIKLKNKTR